MPGLLVHDGGYDNDAFGPDHTAWHEVQNTGLAYVCSCKLLGIEAAATSHKAYAQPQMCISHHLAFVCGPLHTKFIAQCSVGIS